MSLPTDPSDRYAELLRLAQQARRAHRNVESVVLGHPQIPGQTVEEAIDLDHAATTALYEALAEVCGLSRPAKP